VSSNESKNIGNILFLGSENCKLYNWLRKHETRVIQTESRIDKKFIQTGEINYLVSYGYRYILSEEVIKLFSDTAINLHISYLPWNRGADPNLWSIVDGTPTGVSIHYIDNGVDTGDLLVQKNVHHNVNDTLRTSYDRLKSEVEDLFIENWEEIKSGSIVSRPQQGMHTLHRKKDKEKISHLLSDGWDTPICKLQNSLKIESYDETST